VNNPRLQHRHPEAPQAPPRSVIPCPLPRLACPNVDRDRAAHKMVHRGDQIADYNIWWAGFGALCLLSRQCIDGVVTFGKNCRPPSPFWPPFMTSLRALNRGKALRWVAAWERVRVHASLALRGAC